MQKKIVGEQKETPILGGNNAFPKDENKKSAQSALNALRPIKFEDYVGQKGVINSMRVATEAALNRGEALDHVLLHGPPGLGKTTLANIISNEIQGRIYHTSGPALERPADVVGVLSNLREKDVFFIDEIHRLSRAIEEYLYSAMEDFRVDFMAGQGVFARTINLPLKKFTLIGSTTRAGMLSAPLRERFGLQYHLDFYSTEELSKVITRSASILKVKITPSAAEEIALRSRGTPRIANRLLRRVRDYADVKLQKNIDDQLAKDALKLEGVDKFGLDKLARHYLTTLAVNYGGGPTGIEALSASINEEQNTLVDMVEPFLLKIGFLIRTHQGRKITTSGLTHIGKESTNYQNQATML